MALLVAELGVAALSTVGKDWFKGKGPKKPGSLPKPTTAETKAFGQQVNSWGVSNNQLYADPGRGFYGEKVKLSGYSS